MKARFIALLLAVCAAPAFCQVSIMRGIVPYKTEQFQELAADVVVMPKVEVKTWQESKSAERILIELERLFSTPKKAPDAVFIQSTEPVQTGHGLGESAFFDFGMMGKDLKSLKGGFELWGMDFYIKSGLAWHPEGNRYVTYRLGKRTSWSYSFRNQHDFSFQVFRNPIMRFNERFVERPIDTLFEKIGIW